MVTYFYLNPGFTIISAGVQRLFADTVFIRTIKRYICSSGLRGRMASRKPFLTATHVRNRKKWCAAYLNMDTEKRKDFIFSDECRLLTYANVTRLVRHPKNVKYGMNYVVQTKKYEGLI